MSSPAESQSLSWREISIRTWCLVWLIGWQGGFAFYGGVVVPVGARVLGSELEQGLVTQAVTHWLNAIAAIALLSWPLCVWTTRWRATRGVRWFSIGLWLAIALAWAALLWLHTEMDQLVDLTSRSVNEPDAFYLRHRAYLILSTWQWVGCLLLVPFTLLGWHRGDSLRT